MCKSCSEYPVCIFCGDHDLRLRNGYVLDLEFRFILLILARKLPHKLFTEKLT